MDLATFQQLSGTSVTARNKALMSAQLVKSQMILETMLGYTLNPEQVTSNLYNEQGKTTEQRFCPNVDTDNLLPPDPVEGAYRLYDYNPLDRYFHVDPFRELHKVKLVKDGVTIRTFEPEEYRVQYKQGGLAKFIEVACDECMCTCTCTKCVQLAVDADWLWGLEDDLPLDLQIVWADMIKYYADCKKDIKSETLDTHSYTKNAAVAPETESVNLAVIKKYAGPYGSVTVSPTV